jgi:hypothetical protein
MKLLAVLAHVVGLLLHPALELFRGAAQQVAATRIDRKRSVRSACR